VEGVVFGYDSRVHWLAASFYRTIILYSPGNGEGGA